MYYGFRCYDKNSKPLGWLYTYDNGTVIAFTKQNLDWCKRWKTEPGAKKNFDFYNRRWQFQSKGGYLKIEVMPEFTEPSKQRRLQDFLELTEEEFETTQSVWSFQPTPENLKWLEEERCENEDNAALLNRKLEKLRKLEQQGY
ncbi:MAG: hypothetical protein F6K36_22840 [Symploca sp. SIO3C6]|nr:hypothetical protein [Symploca sp. SIO3C6]NET08362.1 hypothetical protein [Symploca sp. SIO2B6]NET47343.1 hypothetical protein [Merismopedia sp. SIO2A8]